MTIEYKSFLENHMDDGFSRTLKESAEYFAQSHRTSIMGDGFKDIIKSDAKFNTYVNKLTEGLEASEEENMRTLLENCRMEILNEAALGGIPEIASLAMPVLRKLWARIALKYAIPTEPVKTPAFSIAFNKPFIQKNNGDKIYLPEGIKSGHLQNVEKPEVTKDWIEIPTDGSKVDLVAKSGKVRDAIHSRLDPKFSIVMLEIGGVEKPVKIESDLYRGLWADIKVEDPQHKGQFIEDTIMGRLDIENCYLTVTTLTGKIKKIKVKGWFSQETHNEAINVSFELTKRDISIGTGAHFEASLPIEFLQDVKALYNIDGAAEVVDILSNVIAQKLDLEILDFLFDSYDKTNAKYHGEFDLYPGGVYAGSPKDYKEELKPIIDHYAQKMKTNSLFYNGYFVIIGNPIDTMIIPNVTWTFNHVADDQNGVEVEYSLGAMSGIHKYQIVSSDLVPAGKLTMFFVPTTNKYLTYKYFPYTFNVVNNYRNTQTENLPSVMMTKRHTFEEFTPVICQIDIIHNDGTLPTAR